MVENFLGHYCKSLSPSQINIISDKYICSNPLYLRTILEELRVFGVFEELTNRIFYNYPYYYHNSLFLTAVNILISYFRLLLLISNTSP